jgi:hypothetical protein
VSVPLLNSTAVIASRTPETMYVPAIIGLRPTESKNRPSSSGPPKLPTANAAMYQPTWSAPTP